jgi:hypothetical protein
MRNENIWYQLPIAGKKFLVVIHRFPCKSRYRYLDISLDCKFKEQKKKPFYTNKSYLGRCLIDCTARIAENYFLEAADWLLRP